MNPAGSPKTSQIIMSTSGNIFWGCSGSKLPTLPKNSRVNPGIIYLGIHSFKEVPVIVPPCWQATLLTPTSPFCPTEYFDLVMCLAEIRLYFLDSMTLAAAFLFSVLWCLKRKLVRLLCFLVGSFRSPNIHSLSAGIIWSRVFFRESSSFMIYSWKTIQVSSLNVRHLFAFF